MDPETLKRERSGFWKRSYDHYGQVETWTCDKRKLNEAVSQAMLDPEFAREFHSQGPRILDKLWGEGTAEALSYRTKTDQDRVQMRFNQEALRDRAHQRYMGIDLAKGKDEMALASYASLYGGIAATGTTSTNTITTTAASDWFIRDEIARQQKRMMKDVINDTPPPKKKGGWKKSPSLLRNIPFACAQGTLLATLQRDFDFWAKPEMELVRG